MGVPHRKAEQNTGVSNSIPSPAKNLVFGRRLKSLRQDRGLSQNDLGSRIGLDNSVARARISRYENLVHEPPIDIARQLAHALNVPLAYLYCDDDRLAAMILAVHRLSKSEQKKLLVSLQNNTLTL